MSTEQATTMGSLDARTVEGTSSSSENQKKMLVRIGVIAGVLIVAVAGYFWYQSMQADKNNEGTIALSRISPVFEAGEFSKALSGDSIAPIAGSKVRGLKALADEYSGTDAGMNASLMAANCLVNLGKYSEALPYFEQAEGLESPVLRMGAQKGIGICKEASGDLQGAIAMYEKAALTAEETGFADQSILMAGLAYEKLGQKDKAGEAYKLIVNKHSESESVPMAKMGLARLGMAID